MSRLYNFVLSNELSVVTDSRVVFQYVGNFTVFVFLHLCLFYYVITQKFGYWKKKKVPYLQPLPLFGNYKDFILLKKPIGDVAKKLYEQFPNEPYIGVYYGTEPTLVVQDPELLKLIMTKDFYYFHGREVSKYANREAITKVIFFNAGDDWKVIRQNLTPLFTTAKMKNMFPLIEKCTHAFDEMLERETSISNYIEGNALSSRFTMDCVGSCAFGIETNLMQKDFEKNPFRHIGDLLFGKSDISGYKNIFRAIWPKLFYALGLQSFPPEVKDNMVDLFTSVFKLRENKPTSRNDFVDLVLSLKEHDFLTGESINSMKTGEPKQAYVKLDDEVMAGQCAAFFGGAFETSATTFTMTLFELAKNSKAQLNVQKEVDEYFLKHNKLEYDCIRELPYLNACVDESLRMYPAFNNLAREVMEDYTLPTGLHLDKGVRVHIPIYYIHRNPRNFTEPEQFRPERFMPENRHKIKPFTYLPFGEGPRVCIGLRFARMQVNAGLITVLKNYDVHLADGMPDSVDFNPRVIVSHTLGDVNFKLERRVKNND